MPRMQELESYLGASVDVLRRLLRPQAFDVSMGGGRLVLPRVWQPQLRLPQEVQQHLVRDNDHKAGRLDVQAVREPQLLVTFGVQLEDVQ